MNLAILNKTLGVPLSGDDDDPSTVNLTVSPAFNFDKSAFVKDFQVLSYAFMPIQVGTSGEGEGPGTLIVTGSHLRIGTAASGLLSGAVGATACCLN